MLKRALWHCAIVIWEIPGGTEQWSFSWTGAHFVNGRLQNRLAPDEVVTEDMARLSAAHLFYEYTRQTGLLPKLFAEYGQDKGPKEPPKWPERITSALKMSIFWGFTGERNVL